MQSFLGDNMNNCHLLEASCSEKDLNNVEHIHKRRSSVFQSRAAVIDECKGEQIVENEKVIDTADIKYPSTTLEKQCFNLEEYVSNLKNERKQWIEVLKKRRTERKTLEKQRLCLERQGQPLNSNVLTENEKDFVTARPNYQHICKRYKKLSDVTMKMSVLHNMVYNFNERFIFQMEERLHKVTEKVIDLSK